MAYKFQLGAAVLSGSLTQKGNVLAEASVLSGSSLALAGTAVTATAAELNILDGVTADADELNLLVGSAAGSVVNSKAVIYDASGEVVADGISLTDASGLAGAALSDNSGILDVQVQASGGIEISSSALQVKQSDNSLFSDENGLRVRIDVNGGLQTVANGIALSASVAGAGLAISSGVLSLDANELVESAGVMQTADTLVITDGSNSNETRKLSFANMRDGVFAAVSGDATIAGGGALTIAAGAVENSMLAGSITADKLSLGNGLESGVGDALQIELETTGALSLAVGGLDLKSTITGDRTFSNNVIITGDLTVNGTNTILNTQTLEVEDHVITISSGSSQATAVSNEAGIEFGSTGPTLKLNTDVDGAGADGFAFSLPVSASAFHGDGSGLTGVAATDARYSINLYPNSGSAYDMDGQPGLWVLNSGTGQAAIATEIHLSGAYANGDAVVVKAPANAETYNLTVKSVGDDTFETGGDTLLFESDSAALTLVYASSLNLWTIF